MQSNVKPKYFKLGYLDLVSTKLGMKQDVEMITIHMEKKGTKSIVSPKLVLEVVSTPNFDLIYLSLYLCSYSPMGQPW